LELNTGADATTNANGLFTFNDLESGEYTITPVEPDLQYLPTQRTVVAEEEAFQVFYALPKPVAGTLQPTSTTEITFLDTQGLTTRITFPAGLSEEQVTITPMLPDQPNGYLSAGHAFQVSGSESATRSPLEVVGQAGELPPLLVEIQYSQADLRSLWSAEELHLLWKSPDGWVDAHTTCPEGQGVDHDLATKTISASVCQWGTYGLFGPVDQVYVPMVQDSVDRSIGN
jgi:hypothetical protein